MSTWQIIREATRLYFEPLVKAWRRLKRHGS